MNKNIAKAVDLFVKLAQGQQQSYSERLPDLQKALKDFLGIKVDNEGALVGELNPNCPALINYVNPAMYKVKATNFNVVLKFSPNNFATTVSTTNPKLTQILNASNNLAGAINQEILKAANEKRLAPAQPGNTVAPWSWLIDYGYDE